MTLNCKFFIFSKKRPEFKHLRAFIFDSWFEANKGVFFLIRVYNGSIKKGDLVKLSSEPSRKLEVLDIGILMPEKVSKSELQIAEVGYVFLNIKSPEEATKNLGSTISHFDDLFPALPALPKTKPLVFTSIYPASGEDVENLTTAINKLTLEDPAVSVTKEASGALGNGFRCGFLGLLHMDVFRQRIWDEFGIETITNLPNVLYKVRHPKTKEIIDVENVDDSGDDYREWYEPWVTASIISNSEYEGEIKAVAEERRGSIKEYKQINDEQVLTVWEFPLSEIMTDFHDKLKSITKGYVSWEYELLDYREADIKKVIIHVAGDPVYALSFLTHERHAFELGKKFCKK